MRKKIYILAALVSSSFASFGQQDPALTHFMYNKFGINAGATGIDEGYCATLMYRNQWDKVNGAPNSVLFNAEANLERWVSAGVGISFLHDAIGFNRQNNVNLNYSHHLFVGPGVLGIGVGVGIINFGLNPVWVPPSTLVDATLPAGSSATGLDLNFGAFYKASNWYAGFGVTHLPGTVLGLSSVLATTGNVSYSIARHFNVSGGYKKENLGPGDLDINLMVMSELIHWSSNINARYTLYDKIYGGLSFRNSDAVSALIGFKFLDSRLANGRGKYFMWAGYSYDLSIGKLRTVSNGTHEVAIRGCFVPIYPIIKTKHPRWL